MLTTSYFLLMTFPICFVSCLIKIYLFVSTGPGSYDPKRLDKLGNRMITKDNRFKAGEYKNEAPGPGAYEVKTS